MNDYTEHHDYDNDSHCGPRYVVRGDAVRGFIVVDATTGQNAAFTRGDVQSTFGLRPDASYRALQLNRHG